MVAQEEQRGEANIDHEMNTTEVWLIIVQSGAEIQPSPADKPKSDEPARIYKTFDGA